MAKSAPKKPARAAPKAKPAKPAAKRAKPAAKPAKKPPTKAAAKPAKKPAAPTETAQRAAHKERVTQINALLDRARAAGAAKDVDEARTMLTTAIELADGKRTRALVQQGCHGCGNQFILRQQWAEASALYELGIAVWKKGDDTQLTANMCNESGFSLLQLRKVDEGEERIERGLALHTAADRKDGIAVGYYYLSSVAFDRVQMDRAVELGRRAVAASKESDNEQGVAYHSYALARALYEQGHTREAEEIATAAVAIAKKRGLTAVEGNLTNMLANVALDDHRLTEAEERYERALECFKTANLKVHEAITIANLGNLASNEARYDDALERFETALERYREVGETRLAAITFTARAAVYSDLGQFDDAHVDLETALATMTHAGHERRVSFVRAGFAKLAEARGELAEARAHLAETEISLEAVGDTIEMGRMLYAAAGIEADLGDPESAEMLLARAASLDPASLAPSDQTGGGEKRAGMDAVRALRDIAIGRIEMARARRAPTPDEARALRAAATERLTKIEKAKDSLIDRSMEVRRVAARLRAQIQAS